MWLLSKSWWSDVFKISLGVVFGICIYQFLFAYLNIDFVVRYFLWDYLKDILDIIFFWKT